MTEGKLSKLVISEDEPNLPAMKLFVSGRSWYRHNGHAWFANTRIKLHMKWDENHFFTLCEHLVRQNEAYVSYQY